MLKIAICDDEKSYLEIISFKIQKAMQEHIGLDFNVECFSSIDELYDKIQSDKPDIVFLDIMVNNINSVNWLTEHQHKFGNLSFIIMTGFPTETENLSEIDCCYYLLKSKMTDEQLVRAIKRSVNYVTKEKSDLKTVSFGKRSYTIDFQSVLYIETLRNNLLIHCADGNTITIYSTLKKFIKNLPPFFYQCHKCYVVNMNVIKGYEPHNFIISDEIKVPIPPKKYKETVSQYKNYIINL
mgnify:CR=1 FL=1